MNRFYRIYGKRLIDISLSAIGLILSIPLLLVILILIKIEDGGTVIFKQSRLGLNQKVFVVYKFRTMVENAYNIGGIASSESDTRITNIGKILRKTSLDEIPQLVNILKGEMSIIGPRPILEEEFAPYQASKAYIGRFSVLPGLFCTVDIDKRATATREEQFQLDVEYIKQVSLLLDLYVFVKTLISVIQHKNIYKQKN